MADNFFAKEKMETDVELRSLLENVPDQYDDFVYGIMLLVRHEPDKLKPLIQFMKEHPDADTCDIIDFVS